MLFKIYRRRDMPKLIVHLWIADKLAEIYSSLKDPDFYLGNNRRMPFIRETRISGRLKN
jgi:hypothetical protein